MGVFGKTNSPAGRGVRGLHAAATGVGAGVEGETSSSGGIGVFGHAEAPTGGAGVVGSASHAAAIGGSLQGTGGAVALQVAGPVQFTTSGIATVTTAGASVTVSPGVDINATSKILCTLMSDPGAERLTHVTKNPGADQFTIFLTGNPATNCDVAWFVIS